MEEGNRRETQRTQEEKKVHLRRNLNSAFQYINMRNDIEKQILENSNAARFDWQHTKGKIRMK